MNTKLSIAITAALMSLQPLTAAPIPIASVQRPAPPDFERDIKPILKANCTACHNKTTTKAELNLETPELMKKGGESGAGLMPGKGADSLILQAAAHIGDGPMPPKGNKVGAVNLTSEELGLLKLWIDQGAKAGERRTETITWQPLPAGMNPIYSVAITAEGDTAACGRSNQVFIYDVPSRTMVTKLNDDALLKSGLYKNPGVAHRDIVASLAFSPDGSRLASGSYREVKIWKRVAPQPVLGKTASAPPPAEAPKPAAKSDPNLEAALKLVAKKPDRPAMSNIGRAQRAVSAEGLEVAFLTESIQKAEAEIKALDDRAKKSADAKAAAEKSLPDKKKALQAALDAKTAAGKAAQEAAAALAAVPKDKPDEAIAKRDKEAQEKLQAATKKHADEAAALKANENAITDADAETKSIAGNKSKTQASLEGSKARLAAGKQAQDKANKDLEAEKKLAADGATAAKLAALSTDGKLLATTDDNGVIRIWRADAGVPVATLKPSLTAPAALAWADDSTICATAQDGATWSLSLKSQWVLEHTLGTGDAASPITDRANVMRFTSDGRSLLVGSGEPSRSGDLTLWDAATGKLTQNWPDRHRDSILGLDFSPDGKLIASGGADRALRVLDAATGKQLKVFEGHTHHVLSVAWRADGREIVSAGADNMVKVWDYITGDRKKNIEGWDKEVTSIFNIGASDQFVACSGDNKVRIVRSTGAQVRDLPGATDFMESVAATRNGELIVAGGQDGKLRLWEGDTGKDAGVFEQP